MHCPICSSKSHPYMEVYDDRYGYPGVFSLLKCDACGHVFLDKVFSDEELVKLYSQYYPRSKLDVSQSKSFPEKNQFTLWLDGDYRHAYRWVPKKVSILDIGCGFGESLAYHASRGCDVYGVEADENIRRVAEKYGYNVHVGLFDSSLYEPSFFDYVTMDQVIEHVVDPLETLKGIHRILKQDGVLLLSVPNPQGWGAKIFGRKWINWHAPYHLHHYTATSMATLAEKAGFKITRMKTATSSNWLNFQWKHLLTFPAEGKKSEFWGGVEMSELSFLKKLSWIFLFALHKLKINHLITRLFDGLGIGDSRLFFLARIDG